MAANKMTSSTTQERRRSKGSHGNLRLCVITWNVANKEIFDISVKNLIDHAFCVSLFFIYLLLLMREHIWCTPSIYTYVGTYVYMYMDEDNSTLSFSFSTLHVCFGWCSVNSHHHLWDNNIAGHIHQVLMFISPLFSTSEIRVFVFRN